MVEDFLVTDDDEYKIKKMLWEFLNKDWIEDQKDKILKQQKATNIKKRYRKMSSSSNSVANDPVEAIKNSEKFGKKINLTVLENIFSKK